MYCSHCGGEVGETNKFCTSCGAPVERPAADPQPEVVYEPVSAYEQSAVAGDGVIYNRDSNSGLFLAAFVLNILSTVSLACFVIPLAWCIPMTVRSYNIYKGKKPNTVAFGVCTLIFLNFISGILMLVTDKEA